MEMTRRLTLYSCAVLWTMLPCYSAERIPDLDTVAKQLNGTLAAVASVDVEVSLLSRLGPDYAKDHTPREFPGSLRYRMKNQKYVYEIKLTDLKGKEVPRVGAFNGETFQMLERNTGTLSIVKGEDMGDGLSLNNALWMPYLPLIRTWRGDNGKTPTLADVKGIPSWFSANLAGKATTTVELLGHRCVRFEIPGEVSAVSGGETSYEVTLATDLGYVPLEWRWKGKGGHTLSWYKVEEVQKVQIREANIPFFYAKRASSSCFDPNTPEKLLTRWDASIDAIEINGDLEEDIFTIDPAEAERIYDGANNTVIVVPKK